MKYIYLLVILVIISIIYYKNRCQEKFSLLTNKSLTYYKSGDSPLPKEVVKMFNSQNIFKVGDPYKADIYLPSGYTNVEKEYEKLPYDNKKYIHAIKGCDKIASKNYLWKILENYYGRTQACKYMPNSYLLNSIKDKLKLLKDVQNTNKILVLKKNLQRQQGLKFCNSKELSLKKLNEYAEDHYVIAQEYLNNPFIINGRKINMRFYLLIVIDQGVKKVFLYNNGFIYYTNKKYEYSTDPSKVVTTGYIDRKVYEENPLTHSDFQKFLKNKGINYNLLFDNVRNLMIKVLKPIFKVIEAPNGKVNYQVFGIDIQPDKNLDVKLLEINKALRFPQKTKGMLK